MRIDAKIVIAVLSFFLMIATIFSMKVLLDDHQFVNTSLIEKIIFYTLLSISIFSVFLIIYRFSNNPPVDESNAELLKKNIRLNADLESSSQQLRMTIEALAKNNLELNDSQQELKISNNAKDEFIARMSHEIRTPLTAIIGFSNLLKNCKEEEAINEYTYFVNQAGLQLQNIIDNVLRFSKLERLDSQAENHVFDLRQAIENVTAMLTSATQEKKLNLIWQVQRDIPEEIIGDVVRIEQVLTNLVGNAIKFTETGSVFVDVTLDSTYSEGAKIRFDVIDTGIGVPDSEKSNLFNAFYQIDSNKSRQYSGVGLGLAISKNICTLLGGEIGVEDNLQDGSCFWFVLPFKFSDQTYVNPVSASFSEIDIIVYDQDSNSRRVLRNQLLETEAEIYATANDKEYISLIKNDLPDTAALVLSLSYSECENKKFIRRLDEIRLYYSGAVFIIYNNVAGSFSIDNLHDANLYFIEKPMRRSYLLGLLISAINPDQPENGFKDQISEVMAVEFEKNIKDAEFNVLVVEDNQFNARLISTMLSARNINSTVMTDSGGVIALLQHNHFDLLLMDIHMPSKNGFELASEIRHQNLIESIVPIIAFTADIQISDDVDIESFGINGVLFKPVTDESLDKELARWLDLSDKNDIELNIGFPDVAESPSDNLNKSLNKSLNKNVDKTLDKSPGNKLIKKNYFQSHVETSIQFQQRLQNNVKEEITNIVECYKDENQMELKYHLHQLEGVIGYFQLEKLLRIVGDLKLSIVDFNDDLFYKLISQLENALAEV